MERQAYLNKVRVSDRKLEGLVRQMVRGYLMLEGRVCNEKSAVALVEARRELSIRTLEWQ